MKSKEALVTIVVLTYGEYPSLIQRTVNSIVAMCDSSLYKLVVGANAPGENTLDYLEKMREKGNIDELIVSETNLNKCPMMQKLFKNITTEYIWWFDDDSFITDPSALDQRLQIIKDSDSNSVMWGHLFFFGNENDFNYGTDVVGFVKSASWYKGLEPPSWDSGGKGETNFEDRGVGDGRWFFITGGNWIIRTSAIQVLDWPDKNLIKRNDDVFLCEAIRQQGWSFHDIGTMGVAINTEERRGDGEDQETMEHQMNSSGPQMDLTGWFLDEEKPVYRELVEKVRNGIVVEIGLWKGLSISSILDTCVEQNNQLFGVDNWSPPESDLYLAEARKNDVRAVFEQNMQLLNHADTVKILEMDSVRAADNFKNGTLDLVFIDGDNTYEGVISDINAWWPKLKEGGILSGHDLHFMEGVGRALNELLHERFQSIGGSIWMAKKDGELREKPLFLTNKKGNGCIFLPTFNDTDLLLENFAGRPELTKVVDIVLVDDNTDESESERLVEICKENSWIYEKSMRGSHGHWTDEYDDLEGFNHFFWHWFTKLGESYDFVVKTDTDAYIISPSFIEEFDFYLTGNRASAGNLEYRNLHEVDCFFNLDGIKPYNYQPQPVVPHLQGGIYGLSKQALKEIHEMGFIKGTHVGFAEDGYLSYCCMVLGIPLMPVHTVGSWYHPYIPPINTIKHLKAVHPMLKSRWQQA